MNEERERLKRLAEAALPASLPGHWTTPEGRETALEYATKSRGDLMKGDLPDLAMANAVFLADRADLDLIHYQQAAKERIRWLSVQLALANAREAAQAARVKALEEGLSEVRQWAANMAPRTDLTRLACREVFAEIRDRATALLHQDTAGRAALQQDKGASDAD